MCRLICLRWVRHAISTVHRLKMKVKSANSGKTCARVGTDFYTKEKPESRSENDHKQRVTNDITDCNHMSMVGANIKTRGSAACAKMETLSDLESFQATYEQRFGCCICLGPKLNMVSGQCQHRICDECLYEQDNRRPCMKNCPVCSYEDSFPLKKPVIPAQVIDTQRCLGVQECPNRCPTQMWYWEVEDHIKHCPNSKVEPSPKKNSSTRVTRKRHVTDLGVVSVTSRCSRGQRKQNQRVLRPRTLSRDNSG